MKSYTDLEQSKKLAEILPLESADMYYHYSTSVVKNYYEDIPNVIQLNNHFAFFNDDIPCWSLMSLLSVLPDDCGIDKEDGKYVASYIISNECGAYTKDNPIDACYEMITRLHELKVM